MRWLRTDSLALAAVARGWHSGDTVALYPVISVEEALKTIMEHTRVLPAEAVPLDGLARRVLAEEVLAPQDVPAFAVSAVDGYAVSATDGACQRRVVGEVPAGQVLGEPLAPGTAVRIMTGAPLPPGTDAVVMLEDAEERDGLVRPSRAVGAGQNVHSPGQDISRGQRVLERGTELGPAEIGLLASLGRTSAAVYRRPRVSVLTTGDELVEPGQEPPPGGIPDSNRYALLAAVEAAGAVGVSLGRARDSVEELEQKVRAGLESADAVLTSGGASVGSRDLIKPVLERLGRVHFGRVAIKPGKPMTFATVDPSALGGGVTQGVAPRVAFGLPGFPVSSLVAFEVFVRPALRKMQGMRQLFRPGVRVELANAVRPTPDRMEYQRAVVSWRSGRLVAVATGQQFSSRLLSLVGSNALVIVPAGDAEIPAGSQLDALLTGDLAVPAGG